VPRRERNDQLAMNCRRRASSYYQATVLELAANTVMARSISPALRMSTGRNSTPSDGATVWIAPNSAGPAAMAESRRTATRAVRGAISLSSHFVSVPAYSRFPETKVCGS
jgi:hypothetical protein